MKIYGTLQSSDSQALSTTALAFDLNDEPGQNGVIEVHFAGDHTEIVWVGAPDKSRGIPIASGESAALRFSYPAFSEQYGAIWAGGVTNCSFAVVRVA